MDVMVGGVQVRMARAALELSLDELAAETGLGVNTIGRFEARGQARIDTVRKIVAAFRKRGITFNPDGSVRPPQPAEVAA
jgi:transcriptional regulator with XRE-family HTH domain